MSADIRFQLHSERESVFVTSELLKPYGLLLFDSIEAVHLPADTGGSDGEEKSSRGRNAALHGRHRRPPHRARNGADRRSHGRNASVSEKPGIEIAQVRVNLIAAGFVDTPLSASLLGNQLDARREQLRNTLPIGRVVGPADIAALAVHIMTNTALTGGTYDIDGGQQLVAG